MTFRSVIRSLAAAAVMCTTMAAAPAQAVTFTVKDCDNPGVTSAAVTGAGTTDIVITCSSAPSAPGAPTGCSIGVTGSPVAIGGGSATVALNTGSCSATDASTTYQWFKGGASQGAASTAYADLTDAFSDNSGGTGSITHTFSLKVCNGTACMTTPSKSVTQTGPTGGSTGGSGGDLCGSASVYEVALPQNGQIVTQGGGSLGGFFGEQIFVGRWTMPTYPTGTTVPTTKAVVSFAEYGAGSATREMTISNSKCDFRADDKTGVNGPFSHAVPGTSTATSVFVSSTKSPFTPPGSTVYVNIRNVGAGATPGYLADMLVVTKKP